MKPNPSRQVIESARLKMLEARQALEAHEHAKGYLPTSDRQRLYIKFRKAAQRYLKLSQTQGSRKG